MGVNNNLFTISIENFLLLNYFCHIFIKILSFSLKTSIPLKLKHVSTQQVFNTQSEYVYLTGVIIHTTERYFTLLDAAGTLQISKSQKLSLNMICEVKCRVYQSVVFCVDIKRITIYQEMFKWIEIFELGKYEDK